MTKDARRDAHLAAHFQALNEIEMPTGLSARLRAGMDRPAARRGTSLLAAVAAAALLVLVAFALGRASALVSDLAYAPSGTAAPRTVPALLGTARDGNVLTVRLSGVGIDRNDLRLARLRLSDGTDLSPEAIVANPDGSVSVRYSMPSEFGFARPNARIELPLGTGVWVQPVDLR